MIRAILHWATRLFERRYDYDASYSHEVIDIAAGAGFRLALFPLLTQYRGPKAARGVWAGALLASTMEGDCGPCVQLVVDVAVEAGVAPEALAACAEWRSSDAGDVGLGFRFAMAAIADDPQTDALGNEISALYGEGARLAASFAAASGRFYPVFKRSLGHGQTCARLRINGHEIAVARGA